MDDKIVSSSSLAKLAKQLDLRSKDRFEELREFIDGISYEETLAFNTSEIVFETSDSSSDESSPILGTGKLNSIKLG